MLVRSVVILCCFAFGLITVVACGSSHRPEGKFNGAISDKQADINNPTQSSLAQPADRDSDSAQADQSGPFDTRFVSQPQPVKDKLNHLNLSWYRSHEDSHKWSQYLLGVLLAEGGELLQNLPQDINKFCPEYRTYSTTDRALVYLSLFDSISLLESSHDPDNTFSEKFKDKRSKQVVSRGLLQLSFESMQAYHCGISSDRDLHNPYKNLYCGFKVMNLIVRDGVISGSYVYKGKVHWQGASAYWAVLRTPKKLKKIKSNMQQSGICLQSQV